MSTELLKRSIDLLLNEFYKKGYITVSRRFGKYLNDPAPISGYVIDILAKRGRDFAIGLILSFDEIRSPSIKEKITTLASRRTKFSNRTVPLFIGVSPEDHPSAAEFLGTIDSSVRSNIELFPLEEQINISLFQQGKNAFANTYGVN